MTASAEAVAMATVAAQAASAKLAEESPLHLAELREMVSSPAGSTIRAIIHMDRTAVRGNIIDAVSEAYDRNVELG